MSIPFLAKKLGQRLKERNLKLVTAESCTGGGLAFEITNIAGSSAWFERGFVTYSNASKIELLDVAASTIEQHGAVSEACAREMAEGALRHSQADLSMAITGIAGPSGGSREKPVGLVWIAYAGKAFSTHAETAILMGRRQEIREKIIEWALQLLLDRI